MENREIKVLLCKQENKDCLIFNITETEKICIDLNSDDQANLKKLFYDLIKIMFDTNIILELDYEEGYDKSNIFANIADEYINALKAELITVRGILPKKIIE